jgi:predicted amidophosphoribosyltransferase
MFAGPWQTVNRTRPRKSTIRQALATLGAWLAPPQCVLCDRPGLVGPVDLCADCLAGLPRTAAAESGVAGDFERLCCPWRFEFPIDALVRALKFQGERCHARVLGTLLARERLRDPAPLPDRIVPVPLHPRRLRERG